MEKNCYFYVHFTVEKRGLCPQHTRKAAQARIRTGSQHPMLVSVCAGLSLWIAHVAVELAFAVLVMRARHPSAKIFKKKVYLLIGPGNDGTSGVTQRGRGVWAWDAARGRGWGAEGLVGSLFVDGFNT